MDGELLPLLRNRPHRPNDGPSLRSWINWRGFLHKLASQSGLQPLASWRYLSLRWRSQMQICLLISMLQISTVFFTHLPLPANVFILTKFVLDSVLTSLGSNAWLHISTGIDTELYLGSQEKDLEPDKKKILCKSEALDSWGITLLFKIIPTFGPIPLLATTYGGSMLTIVMLGLAVVSILRVFYATPAEHIWNARLARNDSYTHLPSEENQENQENQENSKQMKFIGLRKQRFRRTRFREMLVIILGGVLLQFSQPANSQLTVVVLVVKDLLSIETNFEKLSKNAVPAQGMLELAWSWSEWVPVTDDGLPGTPRCAPVADHVLASRDYVHFEVGPSTGRVQGVEPLETSSGKLGGETARLPLPGDIWSFDPSFSLPRAPLVISTGLPTPRRLWTSFRALPPHIAPHHCHIYLISPCTMCDFEEFLFECGCSEKRLKSYCHFARNDPQHQCYGVKKLRDVWEQKTWCDSCTAEYYQRQQSMAASPGAGHGGEST